MLESIRKFFSDSPLGELLNPPTCECEHCMVDEMDETISERARKMRVTPRQ